MESLLKPVYGPFELVTFGATEGAQLTSFPYRAVAGAKIVASISDNFSAVHVASLEYGYQWAQAEISVWGSAQGYDMCLKRQNLRTQSGPMTFDIPSDESFETITIRGRNMSGGRPGGNPVSAPTLLRPFSITAMIFVQQRARG